MNFKPTLRQCPVWKEIINIEIESITNNHIWELIDLPPKSKSLGYKWIFKRKMKVNGTIDKYNVDLLLKDLDNKKVSTILTHIHLC